MPPANPWRAPLTDLGQHALLDHWEQLPTASQERLAAQLAALDWSLLARLRARLEPTNSAANENWADVAARAKPPHAATAHKATPQNPDPRSSAWEAGADALARGEVGAILVAGGQASRLKCAGPKGMFPIGPVSRATLYQILAEQLVAVRQRFGGAVPLYVMTSDATHEPTRAFFRAHANFGLPSHDVSFFCQGTLPAWHSTTGNLLLEAPDRLALSPDGHGGLLPALVRSGLLDDMAARGLQQLFYFQVDNPLVRVCDPDMIGHHRLQRADLTTKVVQKLSTTEKMGVVVELDGRTQLLEYTHLNDLAPEIRDRRTADGRPVFWAGSIAVHVFDRAFLSRVARACDDLPFHAAHKPLPSFDPERPAAIAAVPAVKFERFIFDIFPRAERVLVVETNRADEFAPLKNDDSAGYDCPRTVQTQMIALHTQWLTQAGVAVEPGVPVEIGPLWAWESRDLARKDLPARVSAPRYFTAASVAHDERSRLRERA